MAGKTAGKRKEIVTDKVGATGGGPAPADELQELAMAMRDVMRHDPTGRSVYRIITSGEHQIPDNGCSSVERTQ